jgi:hypothetical protein
MKKKNKKIMMMKQKFIFTDDQGNYNDVVVTAPADAPAMICPSCGRKITYKEEAEFIVRRMEAMGKRLKIKIKERDGGAVGADHHNR